MYLQDSSALIFHIAFYSGECDLTSSIAQFNY